MRQEVYPQFLARRLSPFSIKEVIPMRQEVYPLKFLSYLQLDLHIFGSLTRRLKSLEEKPEKTDFGGK